jgi:hypothetical protein
MAEDERRGSARQRAVLRGCVYYNKRGAAADCLIRDVSDSGARLELSENVVIPDLIELYIPKKGETYHARVLWRRGNEVGVEYVDGRNGRDPNHGAGLEVRAEHGHNGVELEGRMQKLEAEILSLKGLIRSVVDDAKKRTLRLPH